MPESIVKITQEANEYSHSPFFSAAWSSVLLLLSALLLIAAVAYFCFSSFKHRPRLRFERRLLLPALLLALSVVLNRFAVGIAVVSERDGIGELNDVWLEVFNSILHMFQTFSLDESYTEYLNAGIYLARELTVSRCLVFTYGIATSIQNALCAMTSASVILSVLSRLFPRIRLWFSCLAVWKPICYFSAINPESVALAKSMRNGHKQMRDAILVFCDVHNSEDDEVISELKEQAIGLGATCLKDDLSVLPFSRRKGKMIFLMDKNEEENLQVLSAFASNRKRQRLSEKDETYIFSKDDMSAPVIKMVRESVRARLGRRTPRIKDINKHQTLVYGLIEKTPLYTALKPEDTSLHIVIVGAGSIGMEMLLASYWCGQMLYKDGEQLKPRKLRITLVSKESHEEINNRLNTINPDLLNTTEEARIKRSEIYNELLRIYPKDSTKIPPIAEPYCDYQYIQQDVQQVDMHSFLKSKELLTANYFAVAVGEDEENIAIAEQIARSLLLASEKHDLKDGGRSSVPVACAVYNDHLAKAIEEYNGYYKLSGGGRPRWTQSIAKPFYASRIVTFGSLGETYDYRSLIRQRERALTIHGKYGQIIQQKRGNEERYLKDMYTYWSDVARAIHTSYKAFSSDCLDELGHASVERYESKAKNDEFTKTEINMLSWLEHRRWNAFMRTRGFRCPKWDQVEKYIGLSNREKDGGYKSLALKLHPCIVECDQNGLIDQVLSVKLKEGEESDAQFDMLDNCTIYLNSFYNDKARYGFEVYNFKEFDGPSSDFD